VSRRHLAAAIVALSSLIFATQAAAQAPSIELHEIDFYVHVDTLGATPIGDYQTAIDDALVDARLILQGEQGPADSPCCTELTRPSSLVTFGTTGDGLDVIDFGNDLATLRGVAGTGVDAVFIVDAISHCGGVPSPGAIGCAETPGDIEVITLGALDRDLLGATVAHERGHNANLLHSMGSDCDMMRASPARPASRRTAPPASMARSAASALVGCAATAVRTPGRRSSERSIRATASSTTT
jgi:hypothetical protein